MSFKIRSLFFCTLLVIGIGGIFIGQTAEPPTKAPGKTEEKTSKTDGQQDTKTFGEYVRKFLEDVFTAVRPHLVAGSSAVVLSLLAFVGGKYKMRKSLQEPAVSGRNEVTNSVLIIGIGGSGKTSLVRALTGNPKADPAIKTDDYHIYKVAIENSAEEPTIVKRTTLYLSDYRGQDIGSLFRAFIYQQRIPYSPMRFGHIQSLIIVVDLFEPSDVAGKVRDIRNLPVDEKRAEIARRIRQNIDSWNDQSLDAIFGLLDDNLRLICLFINKFELLRHIGEENENIVKEKYVPIARRLSQRATGRRFIEMVGSAENGFNVLPLRDELVKASLPIDRN